MKDIQNAFPVTEEEYAELEKEYGDLCEYQSWQLIKKNNRNNHTDSQEDVAQEMRMAFLRAASYYKRQCFIENCFEKCEEHIDDEFIKGVVEELKELWVNKTSHGANRQKFGPHQEKMLEKLVKCLVPAKERPSKNAPLRLDSAFATYAKAISWNQQKTLGKKITREKSIRHGQVSLSEFDYLGSY